MSRHKQSSHNRADLFSPQSPSTAVCPYASHRANLPLPSPVPCHVAVSPSPQASQPDAAKSTAPDAVKNPSQTRTTSSPAPVPV
ncbi:hypothetical protein M0R45_019383 [Rubus argutus]|uniref:Uncharacterized protein n=1 Tax=Rubus argutus TaxID=59490 RepID=A0AAW1X5N6_RUBAR